jgi:gliding motility-associated-like protein
VNDRFLVQGQCQVQSFHLEIFDRWGSQVFISNDISNSWDGFCRGEACGAGVYTYFLSITFRDGLATFRQTGSGEVHLVR